MVEGAARFSSPVSALILFYIRGAAAFIPANAMAFGARRLQWNFDAVGQLARGTERAMDIAWVRELWGRLEPHLQGAVYVNHISDDDRPEKVRASFGENLPRLRQIKGIYDKTNLFRVNSNIQPA